jgi:hypothetical protein
MTTGALIFAQNNASVDYIKLAVFAAERIDEFLNIPVSIVTDSVGWLNESQPDHNFDQVIEITSEGNYSQRRFNDGTLSSKVLEWKNLGRCNAYNLSPYDKTLVIDSDYIINSSILKTALDRDSEFQIYKKSFDISGWRGTSEFDRINAYSIPFYWATVLVFEKNFVNQCFFNLVEYIKTNWQYFRTLYSIEYPTFRNDFAFSIAIHIMNGKTNSSFVDELPGSMSYILDRDLLVSMDNTKMKFLIEKNGHLGEYTLAKTDGIDVHVMNKYSLSRFIDGGTGV